MNDLVAPLGERLTGLRVAPIGLAKVDRVRGSVDDDRIFDHRPSSSSAGFDHRAVSRPSRGRRIDARLEIS
jgi:hypothetical protein